MGEDPLLAVGSYTAASGGAGHGVTLLRARSERLVPIGEHRLASPSWVQWHPWLPVLYAVQEVDEGAVTALAVDPDGGSAEIATLPTGGAAPCHLAVTADGRHLLAANYGGGSVAVFALDTDGRPARRTDLVALPGSGPHPVRQQGSHPHQVVPDGDRVTVVDLGTDELRGYRLGDDGRLTATGTTRLPAGSGPRQLVGAGDRCYVLTELGGELLVLHRNGPDTYRVGARTPASGAAQNLPAQLTLSADGTRAYLSNRGPDTVSVFDLTGPQPVRTGEYPVGPGWPRHFAVAGDTLYVASQDGGGIGVFTLGACAITRRGNHPTGTPTCVAIRPR